MNMVLAAQSMRFFFLSTGLALVGVVEAADYKRLPGDGGCRTVGSHYEKIHSEQGVADVEECKNSCALHPRCMAVTYGEMHSSDKGHRKFCHLLENGPYHHADGYAGFMCLVRTDFQCTPPSVMPVGYERPGCMPDKEAPQPGPNGLRGTCTPACGFGYEGTPTASCTTNGGEFEFKGCKPQLVERWQPLGGQGMCLGANMKARLFDSTREETLMGCKSWCESKQGCVGVGHDKASHHCAGYRLQGDRFGDTYAFTQTDGKAGYECHVIPRLNTGETVYVPPKQPAAGAQERGGAGGGRASKGAKVEQEEGTGSSVVLPVVLTLVLGGLVVCVAKFLLRRHKKASEQLPWLSKAPQPGAGYMVHDDAAYGQSTHPAVSVKAPPAPRPSFGSPQRRDSSSKQNWVSPNSSPSEVLRQSAQVALAWRDLDPVADKQRPVSRGASEASTATPSNSSCKDVENPSPASRRNSGGPRATNEAQQQQQVQPQRIGSQVRKLPTPW